MDPKVTMDMIRKVLKENDYEEATDLLSLMLEWLGRGGFKPEGLTKLVIPDDLPRSHILAIMMNKVNEALGLNFCSCGGKSFYVEQIVTREIVVDYKGELKEVGKIISEGSLKRPYQCVDCGKKHWMLPSAL